MGSVYKDRRSGRAIWAIAFRDVNGRVRRERTKAASRTLARRLLAMKEDAVELARVRGLESVDNLKAAVLPMLKAFAMKTFLPHVLATRTKRTHENYTINLMRHILPALGGKALDEVRPSDVQTYLDDRRAKEGAASRTIELEWSVLSALFSLAMRRDMIGRNPCKGIVRPRVEEAIGKCLTEAERSMLLAKAPPPLREVIVFALETAARSTEIRNLVWADYCREQGTVTLRATKAHRDRIIPLSPAALAIVQGREAARGLPAAEYDPHLFLDPETGAAWKQFSNLPEWQKTLEAAGFACQFHDLRRTAITTWIRRGYPLEAVRKLAGHARIEQTAAYCKFDVEDLRSVVEGRGNAHGHAKTAPPKTPEVISS